MINWNSSQAAPSLRVDPDRVMDVTSDPLPALHMNYLIHKDCTKTETFSNNEPKPAYLQIMLSKNLHRKFIFSLFRNFHVEHFY